MYEMSKRFGQRVKISPRAESQLARYYHSRRSDRLQGVLTVARHRLTRIREQMTDGLTELAGKDFFAPVVKCREARNCKECVSSNLKKQRTCDTRAGVVNQG